MKFADVFSAGAAYRLALGNSTKFWFARRNGQAAISNAAAGADTYRTLRKLDLRETPRADSRVVAKSPARIEINVTRTEGDGCAWN